MNNENINNIYTLNYSNVKKEKEKDNKKKNLSELNKFNERLYNLVNKSLNEDKFPLTVGGDHSLAIATALASIKKYLNLGIIWFDSHGDFNTFNTTNSGNIHGLPFAAITNYEKKELTKFHLGNFFNPKNAVIVGGRDIEPLEVENLKDAGVTIFTTDDIQKQGADIITKKAFEIASHNTEGIHISFDLDLIDPNIAMGVSIPAENGINLTETNLIIDEIILNKYAIKSLDLVEYNPLFDVNNQTLDIALSILNKLLDNI